MASPCSLNCGIPLFGQKFIRILDGGLFGLHVLGNAAKSPKALFTFTIFQGFFSSHIRTFLVIVACTGLKLWTIHIGCYLKSVLFNPLIFSLCVRGALNMWQYVTIWSKFMNGTWFSCCKHVWLLLSCICNLIRPE